MKWWKWTALAVLAAIAVMTQWHWRIITFEAETVQTLVAQTRQFLPQLVEDHGEGSAQAASTRFPRVNQDALFADLEALAFERYEASDRASVREYLMQSLAAAGWNPVLQPFGDGVISGVNVVAERPGTDPDAGAILVGAHYDTVIGSPGADDNASSMAVALEVARQVATLSTPRSLKIAFFDLEEAGLLGSQAFVAVPENLMRLEGALVMDMVGYACHTAGCQKYPEQLPKILQRRDRGDFLAIIGGMEHTRLLKSFRSRLDGIPLEKLSIPLRGLMIAPDLLRSDHAPFWQNNIPAVLLTDTANFRNANYHRTSDALDTIDRPFLAGSAQAVLDAAVQLLTEAA